MSKLLEPADLRPLVEAVIAAHPDAVNPVDQYGACLYTSPDDPNRHCVVGQLAADQGWEVPGPDATESADYLAERIGWPVTANGAFYLWRVQERVDVASKAGEPWCSVDIPVPVAS